jgi:hypothetical protein
MIEDREIDSWRSEWVAGTEDVKAPAGLRLNATRQQRNLRAAHVAELLTACVFVALGAAVVWRHPAPESFLWAAIVWASTAVAVAFSVWNWSLLWKSDLKSVLEFAQDYEKRACARLRAATFGQGLLVAQLAISVPWLTLDYFRHRITGGVLAGSLLVLGCLTLGFALLFAWQRRVAKRELRDLDGFLGVEANPSEH